MQWKMNSDGLPKKQNGLNYAMEGGRKILNEIFAGVPIVNAKLKQRLTSVSGMRITGV